MNARRRWLMAGIAILLIVAAVAAFLILRPGTSGQSARMPHVTIACGGSLGVDQAACVAWGDGLLAAGPPSNTFEMEDLVRLVGTRDPIGIGPCTASWYISRYPDRAVWTEEARCPGS